MKHLIYFTVLLLLFNSCNEGLREMPCIVDELVITTGDCTSDTTYTMEIDFIVENAGNDFFEVYNRDNEVIGLYELNDLPIIFEDYQSTGTTEDYIKVCINDNPDCCEVVGFLPPDCSSVVCLINDLTVDVGECTSDSTYSVTIDFNPFNAASDSFDVYIRNDVLIGSFNLDDLPLTFTDFTLSGQEYDFIQVCINDNPDCCAVMEFMPPNCEADACDIYDLNVSVGECTSDSTYAVMIDFEHANAGNDFFEVFIRDNELIGYFELADLPVTINHFETSGNDFDFIKVCINDVPDCCAEVEFMAPDCQPEPCDIYDLMVDIGECTSDSTYALTIDFEHVNAGNDFFEVFIRDNELIGYYELADLPVTINHFETSGNDFDYIKVCINDVPDCCAEVEFMAPECLSEACEIGEISIDIGECTTDSTYNVTIDFDHSNVTHDHFDVFIRNDIHIGYFALASLPLTLHNFDLSGYDADYIKVCINDNSECCSIKEYLAPVCE